MAAVPEPNDFPAYLASFIKEVVVHLNDLLWQLSSWQEELQQDFWQELLEELYRLYADEQELSVAMLGQEDDNGKLTQQVVQLLAWLAGEPLPPYKYEDMRKNISVADGTAIAFITCVNNEELYREARIYLEALKLPEGMKAEYIPVRGASSMCQGYNQGAAQTQAKYKVYVHQDALIVNQNFVLDLLKIFRTALWERWGLLGLDGCQPRVSGGMLCAAMAECFMPVSRSVLWKQLVWSHQSLGWK